MCPPASEAPILNPPARTAGTIPDCVPSDAISQAAYKHAAQHLHPTILSHSLRVFLYAKALGQREQSPYISQIHLLFAASILHDIGTCAAHDGEQRFEVEGADAAKDFLVSHNVPETEAHDVWIAIACHTSPGIGERISALARLLRLGVTIDFKRPAAMGFTSADEVEAVEKVFARGEIEKVLADVVVEQVSVQSYGLVFRGGYTRAFQTPAMAYVLIRGQGLRRPEKAPPASWPGVLVRSAKENPGWEGVNKAF